MYGTFEIAAASWQTDNIVRSEKGIIEQRAINEHVASMYLLFTARAMLALQALY